MGGTHCCEGAKLPHSPSLEMPGLHSARHSSSGRTWRSASVASIHQGRESFLDESAAAAGAVGCLWRQVVPDEAQPAAWMAGAVVGQAECEG